MDTLRNPRFVRIAHKKSIFEAMLRHLKETYLHDGPGNKRELICEEVVPADKVVTQESFQDVEEMLEEEINGLKGEMNNFQLLEKQ